MENNIFTNKKGLFAGFTFAFLIIFYVIINFLFGFLINYFLKPNTAFYQSAYLLVSTFSLVVVMLVAKRLKREKFSSFFSVRKFSPIFLIFSLLLSFGMLFGLGFLNELFTNLISKLGIKVQGASLTINSIGEYFLFLFTVCVFPAVLEEFLFRGILLSNLKGAGRVFAVFISALCFSLYHLNLSQLIYQFIYGLFLGFLTLLVKSVIPAIISHFINNFVILTCTYLNANIDLKNPIFIVLGLIALIFVGLFIGLKLKKQKSERTFKKGEFFIPFGIVGLLASSVVIVLGVI